MKSVTVIGITAWPGQAVAEPESTLEPESDSKVATCSCGSGIPVQKLEIGGIEVTLVALPLIFARFREAGKLSDPEVANKLMQTVKIYNPIPDSAQDAYAEAILKEFKVFCQENE